MCLAADKSLSEFDSVSWKSPRCDLPPWETAGFIQIDNPRHYPGDLPLLILESTAIYLILTGVHATSQKILDFTL